MQSSGRAPIYSPIVHRLCSRLPATKRGCGGAVHPVDTGANAVAGRRRGGRGGHGGSRRGGSGGSDATLVGEICVGRLRSENPRGMRRRESSGEIGAIGFVAGPTANEPWPMRRP